MKREKIIKYIGMCVFLNCQDLEWAFRCSIPYCLLITFILFFSLGY